MTEDAIDARTPPDPLFSRLPAEIVDSFTAEQRAALWQASHSPTWRRYPVNIRLSLKLPGKRYFLTIVAGPEQRSASRWQRERKLHPLRTVGNIVFLLAVAALFYVAAVTALFLLGMAL